MFSSTKEVEVRYAETDMMGVVYHANYLAWCELGRTQIAKDLGFNYAELEAKGYMSPVLDFSIQYKAPMCYGQVATVKTWIEAQSKVRTVYGYEITHEDGTVAVTAKSVHTLVRREDFRPVAFSKVDPTWHAKYVEVAKEQ